MIPMTLGESAEAVDGTLQQAEPGVVQGLGKLIRYGRDDLEFCLEFCPSYLTAEQGDAIFSVFHSNGYQAWTLVNPEVDFPPYEKRTPQPCTAVPDEQVDILFSRVLT